MTDPAGQQRILLGQLFSNGDCLYATTVARQIKTDLPGCHLTWAISRACRPILEGNPDVDAVWEVEPPPLRNHLPNAAWDQSVRMWDLFKIEARARQARGEFEQVFLTQVGRRNMHLYDGTIRSVIYSGYPGAITVPMAPVLRLGGQEVENVRRFVASHPVFAKRTHRILFECAPQSGQAGVNPEFALEVAGKLLAGEPDACVVLSSNVSIRSDDERIIDGSGLTLRENAELTKSCTLFIGCSSGISWLCTSDWAKPLPMIQLPSEKSHFPNSVVRDHRRWHLPTDGLLEMIDCPADRLCACVEVVFRKGFAAARERFHEEIDLANSYDAVQTVLLRERLYRRMWFFCRNNLRREGWRPRLIFGPVRVVWLYYLAAARSRLAGWVRSIFPGFRKPRSLQP